MTVTEEYSKTCLKQPLKKDKKKVFKTNNHLMQVKSIVECSCEHSTILLTCIKLQHGFKTFVLSVFGWWLKTGFSIFFLICLV